MIKRIFIAGALLCMLGVVFGAFGAHGLRGKVTAGDLENWKTAVEYQIFHGLGLLFLSHAKLSGKTLNTVFSAFLFGVILFSGSLYFLSTRSLTGFPASILGPLTPLGGLLLIIGWGVLIAGAIRAQ